MNFVINLFNFSVAFNLLTNEKIYPGLYGSADVFYPVGPEI